MDEDVGWARSVPNHEYVIVKAGTCTVNMPIYNLVISISLAHRSFLADATPPPRLLNGHT